MRILAIDPGNKESALLVYDTDERAPVWFSKLPNQDALVEINVEIAERMNVDLLAVEMIASYGMAVGASVFDTCVWVGRFIESWKWSSDDRSHTLVYRSEAKMHLCRSMRAKDANIRQALIDRYGGKDHAIGRKATPGPLYGMSGDCWSALAVAVTVAERAPVVEREQLALV